MNKPVEIIPTVVPNSLEDVERVREKYAHLAHTIHVDVTDGVFAPNHTWLPSPDEKLPHLDSMHYEVHLMVTDPRSVGIAFAKAGASTILGHVEAIQAPEEGHQIIEAWRKHGVERIGMASLLQTPLEKLDPYIAAVDTVLLMTIASIGTQGIQFDERGPGRVEELHKKYPDLAIGVDGGVSMKNIRVLAKAGATRFCAGSALSKSEDPALEYARLRASAQAEV